MDNRFRNGKIYEITSNNTDMIYIGSCTISLKKRLIVHKTKKCSSKCIIECGDYNINLIEDYSCNNFDELRMREQYWINKYRQDGKNIVNIRDAYITEEEKEIYNENWYKKNKNKKIEKQKLYYKKNKQSYNEYQKEYREKNREKLNILQRNNYEKRKEYIKQYKEKNKERIKQVNQEWYLFNSKKVCNGCFDFIEMLNQY